MEAFLVNAYRFNENINYNITVMHKKFSREFHGNL
jgi:hypothetical protein